MTSSPVTYDVMLVGGPANGKIIRVDWRDDGPPDYVTIPTAWPLAYLRYQRCDELNYEGALVYVDALVDVAVAIILLTATLAAGIREKG